MSASRPLARRRPPAPFRAEAHEESLRSLLGELRALASAGPVAPRELDRLLRRHPRDGRGLFSRSQLIEGLRHLARRPGGGLDPAEAEGLVARLRRRPVRSHSGVTPVTVLTRPHPCPGRCVFCPSDVRMPKSYLSDEPGAQRAADHRFDPYAQTWSRLAACRATGHATDKIELIVLGGTWSAYPEAYQVWFVTRCLEALADFGDSRPGGAPRCAPPDPGPSRGLARLARHDPRARPAGGYNRVVSAAWAGMPLEAGPEPDWSRLEAAGRRGEEAGCRCVGLVLETRPDHVDAAELLRMRRLGATTVQVGVQSRDDRVLAASRRGHDAECSRRALTLLRRAGFKVHVHWMPNLPGATPESDRADFARLFDDPALRPDELKIYPCSLVESADLVEVHRRGAWRPYPRDELVGLLAECLARVPEWCRVTRVIRDIPSTDIVAGNRHTNLREWAETEGRRRGLAFRDIRAREVRREPVDPHALRLVQLDSPRRGGAEVFLEWRDGEGRIAAFLRLFLPDAPPPEGFREELSGAALLRELHVYGTALPVGAREEGSAQHRGLGAALVEEAAARAAGAGYRRLSVISALGTRAYYRRLGFADGPLYQHRGLPGRAGPSAGSGGPLRDRPGPDAGACAQRPRRSPL